MPEDKFVFQSFDKKEKKEQKKTAVALAYDPSSDEAPRVVASGRGVLAEKILSVAKDENIPVHQDAPLAKTLSNLEIGENIPPELYEVVAEILLFVDRMDKWKSVMADQRAAAGQMSASNRKGISSRLGGNLTQGNKPQASAAGEAASGIQIPSQTSSQPQSRLRGLLSRNKKKT